MPSVSFEKCDCGIELKIMKMPNGHKQKYACECGRETAIVGTILDLQYSRDAKGGGNWLAADTWRVRDAS